MQALFNHLLPDPAPYARVNEERLSAAVVSALHLFVAAATYLILVQPGLVPNTWIRIFIYGEVLLAVIAALALREALHGSEKIFGVLMRIESIFTLAVLAIFPWLNNELVATDAIAPLILAMLIGYTACQGSNSVQLPRRRIYFTRLVIPVVAVSYVAVFLQAGAWGYAITTAGWCVTILLMTHHGYTSMMYQIESRRESEAAARTDSLTGLLNRLAILSDLDEACLADSDSAFLLVDLDGFKAINDSYGHPTGDAVLIEVARRLHSQLPMNASIGRLGGDEFAAIVPIELDDLHRFEESIAETLSALSKVIKVDNREVFVAGSAGWTLIDSKSDSGSLIAEADAAMYESKSSQTQNLTGFNPKLRAQLDKELELRQELRAALKRRLITHYAQPIVRLDNYEPVAVELLARWKHHGVHVSPVDFIRIAEETGQAVELDAQSLESAQQLVSTWTNPRFNDIIAKVNISPFHLSNKALLRTIDERVKPELQSRLGLELVESRIISTDLAVRELMKELKEQGIAISIDDFGVGYSSLSYLRELPISEVKLDMSFIRDLHQDPINQGLVRAIVEIASTLNLPTVAEGIESVEDFETARDLGVTYGQGYFIGRPMPFSAINIWLSENIKANAPELL